jgi:magnesium-transporting ATPase (P-type)
VIKDNVIFPRLKNREQVCPAEQAVMDRTLRDIEEFAQLGLRTLVFAYKEISQQDYDVLIRFFVM